MTVLSSAVVVPTLFRHDDLQACLSAVQAMGERPDEIIVVCRDDDLASREIAQRHGASVAIVTRPGLAHAIETALAAARSEVVAFVDDDARPHDDWLARIREHFAADPGLGFLGGRDNVGGDASSGSESLVVGVVKRGKVVGNHHLGKGPARSAMHVKGANMAMRTAAVRALPLSDLVAGTGAQHGNELFLSFAAVRSGFHGLYDPAVQVDHFPAPRQSEDGRMDFTAERTRTDTRNTLMAAWLFLPRRSAAGVLGRALVVGDRDHPGLVWAGLLMFRRPRIRRSLTATWVGAIDFARERRAGRERLRASGWAGN